MILLHSPAMLETKPTRVSSTTSASDAIPGADIATEELPGLLKAGGDRLRLLVLKLLRQDSLAVQELCAILDVRQPALSHHLKVMAATGLVTNRREGNTIFYRRAVPEAGSPLGDIQAAILDTVDAMALPAEFADRLHKLRQEREQSSRQFFAQNAEKFRAQQDLIASYEQYAETVAETLANAGLSRRELALEVGPGDGAFLSVLSPGFKRVIALDNAEEMLASSVQRADAEGLSNIEFIHGDTSHDRLEKISADCIVVNMVLHHTPSPADIFNDLASCLAGDGVLLVTDLCRHDQDWARDACGDLWLGFEPAELTAWAESAGLTELAGVYLAQRNGFQVQVRLFGHQSELQGKTA